MWKAMASVTGVVATLAYPALVYVGLTRFGLARSVWLVIAAAVAVTAVKVLASRGLASGRGLGTLLAPPALILVLALLGAWTKEPRLLLATPTLINVVFLLTFARTLRDGPPMIERFARLIDPALSPAEVSYCRQVTKVWCGFFLCNGIIAAVLAACAPLPWWVFYTGLLAYVLMGLLMAAEYVVRKARFGKFGRGPHDRMLAFLLAARAGKS